MNNKTLYALPYLIWMSLFFAVPTLLVVLVSLIDQHSWSNLINVLRELNSTFKSQGFNAGINLLSSIDLNFTIDAYNELVEPRVIVSLTRTLVISLISAMTCVLVSMPTAYYISRSVHKELWLLLLILPFWINFLIRIFAWIKILGNNGILNNALIGSGVLDQPLTLLYNNFSVTIISIYVCLPFAIMPIFSAIEKFDFSLLEASHDLGAKPWQSFLYVYLPGIRGGITSALVFSFINTFGNYTVARLVGGQNSYMIGNLVVHNATVGRNMPLAAAVSTAICFFALLLILIGNTISQKKEV